MEKDPAKQISELCGRMRELSGSIRSINVNIASTDIPDILEISANIMNSIISSNESNESNSNVYDYALKIDDILKEKEVAFMKKMQELLDSVAEKINDLQNVLKAKKKKIDDILSEAKKAKTAEIDQIERKNKETMKELAGSFLQEKHKLEEKERIAFSDFEKFLADHLSKISNEWNQRIQETDDKIASYQKDLQDLIHNKHQQSSIKKDMLLQEEKRIATEHEKITRTFQNKKNEAEQQINDLKEELKMLQVSITEETEKLKNKYENMEKELLFKRKELDDYRSNELKDLNNKIVELNEEVVKKKKEIEKESVDYETKLKEIKNEYESKIQFEESETQRFIDEAIHNLTEDYNQKASALQNIIDETNAKRQQMLDSLKKIAMDDAENREKEIKEISQKYEEEREKIRETVNQEREKLNHLIHNKNEDIEEIKHKMQKELGAAMTIYDIQECAHADEISTLMKQFEEQQTTLSNFQQMSLEQRNQKRADEIDKLMQEHEMRKNQILEEIEHQIQIEIEKATKKPVDQENQDHSEQMTSMTHALQDIKGRIDLLQMKINGLYKMHNQKLENLMQDNDPNLQDDLKKLQEGGDRKKLDIKDLKERIMKETREVERRKDLVLQEADQINKNINEIKENFEKKIKIMENQFSQVKKKFQTEQSAIEKRHAQLASKIDEQKNRINELKQLVSSREGEATQFEESFDSQKDQFQKEAVEQYKSDLDELKKYPIDFEKEMENLRNKLNSSIKNLQTQLTEEKENSENIAHLSLVKREHALEEAEAEVKLESEQRINQFRLIHDRRIELMKSELGNAKEAHIQKISNIHSQKQQEMKNNEKEFKNQMKKIQEQKLSIEGESKKLDDKIVELENAECPICAENKKILKALISKRDEMKSQINQMHQQLLKSEEKMNSLFPEAQKRSTSSSSITSSTKKKAKIITPKKTALEHYKF